MARPNKPSTRSSDSPTEIAAFRVERLKYILSQQATLNEHSYRYVTLFQTTVSAIVVAAVAVFTSWKRLAISAEIAKAALRALELLLVVTSGFFILVVVTNIASWWDSRREEARLMNDVVGEGFRNPPSLQGVWRWFETWLIILVLIVLVGTLTYFEHAVLPLIK
jgi:hypothetical protein